MGHLSPDQRTAVCLRYDEGLSFAEIGHVLGMPEATARSHVHRARKLAGCRADADGLGRNGPPEILRKPE